MNRSLGSIEGKIDFITEALINQRERLHSLESGRYKQYGIVGVLSGLVSYLTDWVHHGFK